ncbi:helix-turn-helix domain-containing protein [Sinisalibacter aestuarii]|uniref:IclR family transcriptional regulator n=1 Tax=Sinisalibacter aestuarii TaxID=2949426 RepID=A0ABQ5LPF2_9RHOB|nr:helix-turn-helix domain-containing protein [Sinisalibacter aestuarii]GKY86836.1 IclR family transcriptional regulator [Sinisalibacter aestuarii]
MPLTSKNPEGHGRGVEALDSYRSVEALMRGLEVIDVLNRMGEQTIAGLAAATGHDRSTLYRTVATLVRAGFANFDAEVGRVSQGPRIAEIAAALRAEEAYMSSVQTVLDNMTRRSLWPGDFALIEGGDLVIKASSHRESPMTIYRRLVGQKRSITRSALGLCILAAMPDDQRAQLLTLLRRSGGPEAEDLAQQAVFAQRLEATRQQGFGLAVGLIDPRITGIALPVRLPGDRIGAVNLVVFSRVVRNAASARKVLPILRSCQQELEVVLQTRVPS